MACRTSDGDDTSSKSSFESFPRLPVETHLQIWELCYTPRNVHIAIPRIQRKKSNRQFLDIRSHFAHLLVNHEARQLLLQTYPRLFLDHPRGPRFSSEGQAPGWYFNYELDSFCMMSSVSGMKHFLDNYPEDMRHVQYLDVHPDDDARDGDHELFQLFGATIGLRELAHLRLITIRDVLFRGVDYLIRPDYTKDVMLSLMDALLRDKDGVRCAYGGKAKLAAQFYWIEGDDDVFETLRQKFPGDWVLTDEVKGRWDLLGISPPKVDAAFHLRFGATEIAIIDMSQWVELLALALEARSPPSA